MQSLSPLQLVGFEWRNWHLRAHESAMSVHWASAVQLEVEREAHLTLQVEARAFHLHIERVVHAMEVDSRMQAGLQMPRVVSNVHHGSALHAAALVPNFCWQVSTQLEMVVSYVQAKGLAAHWPGVRSAHLFPQVEVEASHRQRPEFVQASLVL